MKRLENEIEGPEVLRQMARDIYNGFVKTSQKIGRGIREAPKVGVYTLEGFVREQIGTLAIPTAVRNKFFKINSEPKKIEDKQERMRGYCNHVGFITGAILEVVGPFVASVLLNNRYLLIGFGAKCVTNPLSLIYEGFRAWYYHAKKRIQDHKNL